MILESLHVQNFRSILDATLTFNDLTVLVGANGSGKSAFLMAIRLLRDPTLVLGKTDFFNRDTSKPIEIEGTFGSLTTAEKQCLDRYVHTEKLTVRREFSWTEIGVESKGFGSYLSASELEEIGQLSTAPERKRRYKQLVTPPDSSYHDMPPQFVSKEEFETDKVAWIQAHPNLCRPVSDSEFFAPKGRGTTYLKSYWEVLYVPAVQDPTEVAQDSRGSVLTKLVDMVARKALSTDASFDDLSAELKKKYTKYLKDHKANLDQLARGISRNLDTLVPGSFLRLNWDDSQSLEVKLPVALPEVSEDGFSSPITHVGSGLQRACTISLLQQLAESSGVRSSDTSVSEGTEVSGELPSYMIIVEEPELYQHPDRQRHLAKVFSKLAGDPIQGVSNTTQVCYCTHSPLFVCIDRFEDIRLCHKIRGSHSNTPKQTGIEQASINAVCEKLQKRNDAQNHRSVLSKLETIMTPLMNEGFFAHAVVLVEGDDDRGAILAAAKYLGYDLEGMGIAVIPCVGKSNLDRPWAVFTTLGIPVYVVWDGDADFCKNPRSNDCSQCDQVDASGRTLKSKCKAHPSTNQNLLEILGEQPMRWPERRVKSRYACFRTNLEMTIKKELTPSVYDELFETITNELGIDKSEHAIKNPAVIKNMLERATLEHGKKSKTLEQIVRNVVRLSG